MAFVIKSKKGEDIKIGETNDIGPGEYLVQTKVKEIKISKAPFLVTVSRDARKDNEVPGPGSYYQDETLANYLKNLQNEKISSLNDKDQVLVTKGNYSINLKYDVEKLGFLQKEKRFKYKQNYHPGPGCYFPSLVSRNKEQMQIRHANSEKTKFKKLIMKRQESSIPSIPVTNQVFGFDVSSNGNLVRKANPDMYRTFSGEKGDTVGPGSYEIDYPDKWHKTGTEWSKMKSTRINEDKKHIDKMNEAQKQQLDHQTLSLRTTRYSDSKTVADRTKMSFDKCRIVKTRGLKALIDDFDTHNNDGSKNQTNSNKYVNNQKEELNNPNLEKIIHRNTPGPGYYFDMDKMSCFTKEKNPDYKQFFGSRMERFHQPKDNSLISPVTYFKDEEDNKALIRKEKADRSTKINAAFNTRTDRFLQLESKEAVPGPGHYEQNQHERCLLNKEGYQFDAKFGSTEKRFSQTTRDMKWQYNTPGPGEYINPFSATSTFNTYKWKGMLMNIPKAISFKRHIDNPIMIRANSTSNKGYIPAVGQYNPELIYTIDYKIKKKKNKTYSEDIAFNSGLSKGKNDLKKSNLGPGYYYKEKKLEVKQLIPPFNQGEMRKMGFVGKGKKIGPGDYNFDSYFDWNKKTFNVNYV